MMSKGKPKTVVAASDAASVAWVDLAFDDRGCVVVSPAAAVVSLDVRLIVRSPYNRRPTPADVDKVAQSIEESDQLDPVVVRPAGDSKLDSIIGTAVTEWELISGETRWLACKRLGRNVLARLVFADRGAALEALAAANAKRTDLNPIQKAQLIAQLCKPESDGGSGYTREQAARMFGLDSAAGASNLVRLLELPDVWQTRIADGLLPQTFGREILRAVPVPKALAELEREFVAWRKECERADKKDGWRSANDFDSRHGVARAVKFAIEKFTRPMDKRKRRYSYSDFVAAGVPATEAYSIASRDVPVLFDVDSGEGAALPVIEIEIDGKPAKVTTAVDKYDALQMPKLLEASKAEKRKRIAADSDDDGDDDGDGKASAAAETKAAQLDKRKRRWRHEWLRDVVGRALEGPDVAPWWAVKWSLIFHASRPGATHDACDDVFEAIGGKRSSADMFAPGRGIVAEMARIKPDAAAFARFHMLFVQLVVRRVPRNPDYPEVSEEMLLAIADDAGVNLAAEWKALQCDDAGKFAKASDRRSDLFGEFLRLHLGDQLEPLANEWGVECPAGGKAARVAALDNLPGFVPPPAGLIPNAKRQTKGKAKGKTKAKGGAK